MSSPEQTARRKLHVVHVISGLGQGGAETVLYRLITAPSQRHEHRVISLGGADYFGPLLREAGIPVHTLSMKGPWSALKGLWRLFRLFRTHRPDVVQTWMYHADLLAGIVARLAGIRAVSWGIRNSGADLALSSRSSRWCAWICARVSGWLPGRIVACAEQAATIHRAWGYKDDRLTVVPNGYDMSAWQPDNDMRQAVRKEWDVCDDTTIIGCVARWNPLKDHRNLIAAMAKVMPDHPSCRLALVGTGMTTQNSELVQLLDDAGLRDHVILMGRRDDVPSLMQGFDMHVLSSRAEGFPNVVAEAMAAGVLNVVTDVGDAARIVGEHGIVVAPRNATALAQGISQAVALVGTPEGQRLQFQARKRVHDLYSLKAMVRHWDDVWTWVATAYPAPHLQVDRQTRLLIVVNNPAFFLSHRLPLAVAARDAGYDVQIATMPDAAVHEIVRHGFSHHAIRLSRSGRNPFTELVSIIGLWRLFRHLQPDIVHAVTIKPVLYSGIAARLARVPAYVAAISGLGYVFTANRRFDVVRTAVTILYRSALKHPHSRIIFQNEDDRDTLVRLNVVRPEQPVMVRGSGVDLSHFSPVPEPAPQPCVAVCVARLLEDKGIREFVEAARITHDAGAPIRWRLAGSPDPGNPSSLSADTVQAWHDEGLIEWVGECDDVAELYQTAHIAVLPSYREGLPKSLIEAAACGRAIVTTNVPGCRDSIVADVTGLLVPVRDAGALAEAVQALAQDSDKRQAMGRAGRALAEREFGLTHIVSQQLAIYRDLSV